VAARSKAGVCGRSFAGIAGLNPAGAWMSVSCECCVLSGRGLCVGLITSPEKSYRYGVSECDCEASIMRRTWAVAPWEEKCVITRYSVIISEPPYGSRVFNG
jgi:hypothetical protein